MNTIVIGAVLGALLLPVPPQPPNPPAEHVVAGSGTSGQTRPDAVWPLAPRPEVVRGFDRPEREWSAGHRGVDLLGEYGESVHAALGGTVSFSGTIAGRGVVVLDHGSFRTTYEPVRASVRRRDRVAAGAVIGTLQRGLSHCAPRSCLHWGLIENDSYRDPLTLLGGGGQVRLLPLDPPTVGLRPGGAPAGTPGAAARW